MIPSQDYSYLGSGSMLIREYGAAAPFLSAGNCSALSLSPQEDTKSLPDYTQPGGNLRNEVRRLTGVDFGYTFHDFSPENFARGLRADVTDIVAGTATAEAAVAYKGGYTPLARIAKTITSVEPAGGGTAYVAGTDYELRDGQLFIPTTSAIPAPTAGAANVDVDYTYDAQKKVEALVNANKQYEVVFVGLNEARSGKRVRVRMHKVSGGVLQEMALLGEDYGAGEINGSLLSDSTKTGTGISQYFTVEIED
ncbi:MAG: hypothetical protein ACREO4_16365 [Lysobacter sp.]